MKKLFYFFVLILLTGCDDFLEKKSDQTLFLPETLEDIRLILDYTEIKNRPNNSFQFYSADEFFITYDIWRSKSPYDQGIYIWDGSTDFFINNAWFDAYRMVMYGNIILERLTEFKKKDNSVLIDQMKGESLFYRALGHFLVADTYCKPFDPNSNNLDLGIPIRLNSDIASVPGRGTVKNTYEAILDDLLLAVQLLPQTIQYLNRPTKAAAYAFLARVYLSMELYHDALKYAYLALDIKKDLLDYNDLDLNKNNKFLPLENPEIIYFMGTTIASAYVGRANSNMDTTLMSFYEPEDIRKKAFFDIKNNGYYTYNISYYGAQDYLFTGFATDELYLIVAECETRIGEPLVALKWLNTLLENRYFKGKFKQIEYSDKFTLLDKVLQERRKELVFRGVRFSDIKRLNRDESYKTTLVREFNNKGKIERYELPPGDLRYQALIDPTVIQNTGIEQNPR